jgi:nitroreductase
VAAAADLRIGSCPMSGLVPAEVHKVLALPDNQWPVCYLALGSHLDTGENHPFPSTRIAAEELFQFLK